MFVKKLEIKKGKKKKIIKEIENNNKTYIYLHFLF
jgi:hypothetical protein